MSQYRLYLLALSILAPILIWLAYFVIYRPQVADSAGGDVFFLLWGAYLMIAYVLNWKMYLAVVAVKPDGYFSFERLCGLAVGIFLYAFFFVRLL